jgi:DNA-binding transcriptional LysR family regulator
MEPVARLDLTHLAAAGVRPPGHAGRSGREPRLHPQGAASQHVAALERAVGAPLIRKPGRNRVLTES